MIDIKETDDCQKVFCLMYKSSEDSKEKLFSFVMMDEEVDKVSFLKVLTKTMANNSCFADPVSLYTYDS